MKLQAIKYVLKEGVANIVKNKIMSVASLGTVIATLLLFGLFYLVIANVNFIADQFQKQPEVTIYSVAGLDDKSLKTIEDKIKADPMIKEYTTITQAEAFAKIKSMLAADQSSDTSILEGLDQSFLPSMTYVVKLNDPADTTAVVENYKKLAQIDKVDYVAEIVRFKVKLQQWIAIASAAVIGLLVLISIFLISNDIKLAVAARRKEIRIMKYVGATDLFIKAPFVIEGVIIGLFGALISFFILGYCYSLLASKLNGELANIGTSVSSLIRFVDFGPVSLKILLTYGIIGLTVGMTGSLISIRKHLVV